MGVEVSVEGLTKSFGSQRIWQDVTLTLPAGEVSALLGPSGTGKSVFLKSLIGLLRPEEGSIVIDGTDILQCSSKELYEIRKLFGVLFQDGALFGSMNLYDNVAFPLREHTRKSESEIRQIVMSKLELVGLLAPRTSCPGRSPGGCGSAPVWRGRWCWIRRSFWWTSRIRVSIRCARPIFRRR